MTVSRPEGHPTDDELIEWRELSREQAELWDSEIDMRLVAVCDALLGERAAHTATKAENARLRAQLKPSALFYANGSSGEPRHDCELPEGVLSWWCPVCGREWNRAGAAFSGEFGESSE